MPESKLIGSEHRHATLDWEPTTSIEVHRGPWVCARRLRDLIQLRAVICGGTNGAYIDCTGALPIIGINSGRAPATC